MNETNCTPAPWFVRTRKDQQGRVVDCFVAAKSFHGYAYDSEIMGDDEYHDGIERRIADANLIAAAHDLLLASEALIDTIRGGVTTPEDAITMAINAVAKANGREG